MIGVGEVVGMAWERGVWDVRATWGEFWEGRRERGRRGWREWVRSWGVDVERGRGGGGRIGGGSGRVEGLGVDYLD